MDKKVSSLVKGIMGEGEKKAPVKSLKLKVKFQKKDDDKYEAKKKDLAAKRK